MIKILCAVTLIASTLSVSPAFAAASQAPTMQPPGLSFVAAKHTRLPWCSTQVKKHCRHHVKAPKTM
jgi:hypothetical protein